MRYIIIIIIIIIINTWRKFMININVKKMLLFTALCILFIGIVSATDADSNQTTDTLEETSDTIESVSYPGNAVNNNEIVKKEIETENHVKTVNENKTETYIEMHHSKISFGDLVSFYGCVYYNDSLPVKYSKIESYVNGNKKILTTDDIGYFDFYVPLRETGTYNITVHFPESKNFLSSSETFNFDVINKQKYYTSFSDVEFYPDRELHENENLTVTGQFVYGNDYLPITYTNIRIKANNQIYFVKTDGTGHFKFTYVPNKGENRFVLYYPGTDLFSSASYTFDFIVEHDPEYTYITLNDIENVTVGNKTTISGYYYYGDNKPLTHTTMFININGNGAYAETDNKGFFSYDYITSKDGLNTVTVYYPGNINFRSANSSKTFNVINIGPQYTYIKLNDVQDVGAGNKTAISGYYYYGDNIPLTYTNMRININGMIVLAKTDKNGFFSYEYTTYKYGVNNVTVYYPGNANFQNANVSKTFNVKKTGPVYTYIKLDNIFEARYGEYVTVSGYYFYGDYIALTYTNMRININGKQVLAKTNDKGYFSYTFKTNKVWKNTVTVSYPGNNYFKDSTVTKSFNVIITDPISTYIKLNSIKEVTKGQYTKISGYYYYSDNIPLTYTNMRININGEKFTAKTDDKGYFTYTYKTVTPGKNNVTVSYPGNTNFRQSRISEKFSVK